MAEQSRDDARIIRDAAARHGVSEDAARTLLDAMTSSGGAMAQFSHRELGGMGQWSRGGMIMVGDMFNDELKRKVAALCSELSEAVRQAPDGGGHPAPAVSGRQWWPAEFGTPDSAGGQNQFRYAVFARARRLVLDADGEISIYDTGEHRITGFQQSQGGRRSLTMTSQHGPVDVASLTRVAPRG